MVRSRSVWSGLVVFDRSREGELLHKEPEARTTKNKIKQIKEEYSKIYKEDVKYTKSRSRERRKGIIEEISGRWPPRGSRDNNKTKGKAH